MPRYGSQAGAFERQFGWYREQPRPMTDGLLYFFPGKGMEEEAHVSEGFK